MATLKIFDRADEFRIEIVGRFSGEVVQDVKQAWERALRETSPRRLRVDISRLSGYDAAGRKLLSGIYRHGTDSAARTASSLVFLDEISRTPRVAASIVTAPVAKPRKEDTMRPAALRAMAAG